MNIPYETIGATLREGAERIGTTIAENETVKQLAQQSVRLGARIAENEALRLMAKRGKEFGESIAENDTVRLLAKRGRELGKAARRRKTAVALTAGFVGGVAVTLLAVKAVEKIKLARENKRRKLELIREEQQDFADVSEVTEK